MMKPDDWVLSYFEKKKEIKKQNKKTKEWDKKKGKMLFFTTKSEDFFDSQRVCQH